MRTNERTVHFYDLILESHTPSGGVENPSCAPLSVMLSGLTSLNPKGHALIERGDVMIEIADWKYQSAKGYLKILINRADRNASDVAFKNFKTKNIRKGGKTVEEGVDYSSHIIIKPQPGQPRALVLMTMGAGVTALMIQKMFNVLSRLLNSAATHPAIFSFPHPSGEMDSKGSPVAYKVRYRYHCVAHQGALLEDALKNGEFVAMELIAHEYRGFDAGGNLQVKRQSISIAAENPAVITAAGLKNAIKHFIRNKPDHQYDSAKVIYKGTAGDTHTATLKTNDLDAAFTRKQVISLPTAVEQQQSTFSSVVISEMEKLL